MPRSLGILTICVCAFGADGVEKPAKPAKVAKEKKPPPPSALDTYVKQALDAGNRAHPESLGSLYNPDSAVTDLARDLRSRSVNDLVVIQVVERASAVSSGDVKTSRQSSVKANVTSLAGPTKAASALSNLAGLSGTTALDGTGTTGRETSISTSLAARVTYVLPNGYLVLEGTKEVQVNSERQVVIVRGVARPADLWDNTIQSDHLADLEVNVNGKGVVTDAIHRPFFLYRLLLGLLPI
ncbi:MAG: flagellar basal body L-ring protein FlgH [Acidobacteriota bacterium]